MFRAILSYMCVKYWNLLVHISCVCLMTAVGMDDTVRHQSCEDLACEHSNVCHASLINDTLASHSYCICRGEWAGLRCQIKLSVMAQSVTTEKVALEMHGYTSAGHSKRYQFEDLYLSELTIALWNFNISDQCLLLRQRNASESVITLEGLIRYQEYLVCITNGLVDSCSFFPHQPVNISISSNCIYFKTKLYDEPPFDVGLIIVLCYVLIFIVFITVLLYIKRHSLLVQLCLQKICCRRCNCCTKHIQIRRGLLYKHRDISGQVLMSPDLTIDFESASDCQTGATGDSSHGRTYSSNASPSTSRRSACSLDPDGSVSPLTSFDHNTFLYENQNLIPPLYSPQDHKVMTLTYIDEDFIPVSTEHPFSNCTEHPIFCCTYPATPERLSQNHISLENMTDCHSLQQQFNIPRSDVPAKTSHLLSQMTCFGDRQDCHKYTGPLKRQYLAHSFSHHPYDKSHLLQHQLHSNHPQNRSSPHDNVARLRESILPNLCQRPSSLPFTLKFLESTRNGAKHSSVLGSSDWKHSFSGNHRYTQENAHSAWSNIYPCRDNYVRSVLDKKPTSVKYFLSSPTRYKSIVKEEKQENMPTPCYHGCHTSNTLPRSRKPRFVLPVTMNDMGDNLLVDPLAANQSFLSRVPAQKPTWLDLPNRTQDLFVKSRSQPATPVASETTPSSAPSHHKSHKHVKNLISHFEHNLSFLKPSRSHRPTDEEKEFRDLQSPLAEERDKISKKSRSSMSSFTKTLSGTVSKLSNENHRHSVSLGEPIFEGHPSEHVLPPFSTEDEDEGEDISDVTTWTDVSDKNSVASHVSRTSTISSYDDDDTNLVTPFVTEDSSDDDTYKNIKSLTGSAETLQDDNLESGQSLLSYEGVSEAQSSPSQGMNASSIHCEESHKLISK